MHMDMPRALFTSQCLPFLPCVAWHNGQPQQEAPGLRILVHLPLRILVHLPLRSAHDVSNNTTCPASSRAGEYDSTLRCIVLSPGLASRPCLMNPQYNHCVDYEQPAPTSPHSLCPNSTTPRETDLHTITTTTLPYISGL
jgi:hypothetical protein